eukprot:6656915-Karenia_brevis.AAC.1
MCYIGIASRVLDAPEAELDAATLLIRRKFIYDFLRAKADRTLGIALFIFLRTWRTKARCDTQDMEGVNSLYTWLGDQSKRITLALMSARACTKKAMGVGARG